MLFDFKILLQMVLNIAKSLKENLTLKKMKMVIVMTSSYHLTGMKYVKQDLSILKDSCVSYISDNFPLLFLFFYVFHAIKII